MEAPTHRPHPKPSAPNVSPRRTFTQSLCGGFPDPWPGRQRPQVALTECAGCRAHGTHTPAGVAPGGSCCRAAAGPKVTGPASQHLICLKPRGPALLLSWASQLHEVRVATDASKVRPLASEVTSVTPRPDCGRTGGPAGRGLGSPGYWTRQENSTGQVTSIVPRDWDQAETEGCSGSHIHVLEGPRAGTSIAMCGAGWGSAAWH